MLNDYSILVLAGAVILIITEIYGIYKLIIMRDVTMPGDKGRMAFLYCILIINVLAIAGSVYVLMLRDISFETDVCILVGSIFVSVIVFWAIGLYDDSKKQAMELLETLVCVLEAGDPNMDGHSLHVHYLALLIYDYLPYDMRKKINRVDLSYASLFFDVGKYGVPGRILNKSGKLGSSDWELIKKHPEICVGIFESMRSFNRISDWILYHHERIDGCGYYQIKDDDIPLASKIIALADTYSSITMRRSYKPTLTYEDAIAELKMVAGSQLDEKLVNIFLAIPMRRVEECMEMVNKKMYIYQQMSKNVSRG
ncbi:MAG: HD domain-containing protein [Lachnospiraceae bacterium]|nr:HD domain-containing protein [Lachnospiraceae bacterium]